MRITIEDLQNEIAKINRASAGNIHYHLDDSYNEYKLVKLTDNEDNATDVTVKYDTKRELFKKLKLFKPE